MERLLEDAEKLSGQEYDISNLGDVYDAIHVIQQDLGLTGVAAAEASQTFSGSFGAMQAAAQNVLGSLAMGENVQESMQQLLTSTSTFIFGNFVPMISQVATTLPGALAQGIQTAIPMIATQGPAMINQLVSGVTSGAPALMTKAAWLITQAGAAITANLPAILDKGVEMVGQIAAGLLAGIPSLGSGAASIVSTLGEFIWANVPVLAQKGGEMLGALAGNIIANLPQIGAAAIQIGGAIMTQLNRLPWLALEAAGQLIRGIVTGITSNWGSVGTAITGTVNTIINVLRTLPSRAKAILNQLSTFISTTWTTIKGRASSMWQSIKNAITEPIEAAKKKVGSIIDGIKGMFPLSIGKIFSNIKLPHISVSGGEPPYGIAGKGSLPSFSIEWNAKAMNNPYMFSGATLFGAGEAGDEIMYGRQNLMRDIREAAGGGGTYTWNIQVDGTENPEEFANRLVRELQLITRTA